MTYVKVFSAMVFGPPWPINTDHLHSREGAAGMVQGIDAGVENLLTVSAGEWSGDVETSAPSTIQMLSVDS